MNVQLFTDITTESVLAALEEESKSYDGLYVEMDDPEQRKYVKDKAKVICDLLKKLDRSRIDKAKDFKSSVEKEAANIKLRLENANKPFTLLIDEYTAERKKILDAKKAKEQAIEDAKQLELDHEFGLLMNAQWDNDKEKRDAERAAEVKRIADEAKAELIAQQQREADYAAKLEAARKSDEEAAELRRINDKEHRRAVNVKSVSELVLAGLSSEDATKVVKALANKKLTHITINY